jgi:hypothetical protein
MEKGVGGLNETLHSLTQRLASVESDASRHPEMERGLEGSKSRLSDLDDRLRPRRRTSKTRTTSPWRCGLNERCRASISS